MKTYEIILFDTDATLLDFDKAEEYGIEALFRRFDVPVTEENKENHRTISQQC